MDLKAEGPRAPLIHVLCCRRRLVGHLHQRHPQRSHVLHAQPRHAAGGRHVRFPHHRRQRLRLRFAQSALALHIRQAPPPPKKTTPGIACQSSMDVVGRLQPRKCRPSTKNGGSWWSSRWWASSSSCCWFLSSSSADRVKMTAKRRRQVGICPPRADLSKGFFLLPFLSKQSGDRKLFLLPEA